MTVGLNAQTIGLALILRFFEIILRAHRKRESISFNKGSVLDRFYSSANKKDRKELGYEDSNFH